MGEVSGTSGDDRVTILEARVTALEAELTERYKVEADLRRSQRFFESIVEHCPDMIFVKDAETLKFVRFNHAGEELVGFSRDELLGRCDLDFFPREEAEFFMQRDREALASGGVVDIPVEPIKTRDQGTRYLHTKKISVAAPNGEPEFLLGISEDITERLAVERELGERTAALARSNRELEEFAYVASHDLQEPLRKINAFGEMLREATTGQLDGCAEDYLDRMQSAARRMQTLIDDLLTFSRVSTRAGAPVAVDLSMTLRGVLTDLEKRVNDTHAVVHVEPLPTVRADPVQARQLFHNLVGNALKFHREGVAPMVTVSASRAVDGAVFLRVQDNGIGFDTRYVDKIFKPFERLHGRGTFEGTGIGLAVCRKVAEQWGGAITAESTPGCGAAFIVRVPAERVLEAEVA